MFKKEEAKERIKKIVELFESRLDFIVSSEYKEIQIQDEFVIPFFKCLNWDTFDDSRLSVRDREFIVEYGIEDKKTRTDILLKVDGKERFFIDINHLKYNLKEDFKYIFQIYRYAYSSRISFALLTNFREFRFFNFVSKVENNEDLNKYCLFDWTYKDYINNFDNLWKYFEKENVRKGNLSKLYIRESENRISVEEAFFEDLNYWRVVAATGIKEYHPDFSGELITEAVRLILDRFLFMKFFADREIEEDYIRKIVNKILVNGDNEKIIVYNECRDFFEELDRRYNGHTFLERPELDSIVMSKKVLLEILEDFLPEKSIYNFKLFPITLFSKVYEQFLGKVIDTTKKTIRIKKKPEVRKYGGGSITPDYIVNYIIKKTVGEKLKKCYAFEDLLKIRICDPACGSGSFLLAAYDALINWATENRFLRNIKIKNEIYYRDPNGKTRLTSKAKREILLSCIYGVDIDPQAIEVTKRSLSLKILEDAKQREIYNERTLFDTVILPDLSSNIKSGNSLIEIDYLERENLSSLELNLELLKSLKPFSWEKEFPIVFKYEGGFDCVIGNPPSTPLQIAKGNLREYYKWRYQTAFHKTGDTCYLFYEKGLSLLNNYGYLCYYSSSNWSRAMSGEQIRRFLIDRAQPLLFISLAKIFKEAKIDANILLVSKDTNHSRTISVKACNIDSYFEEDNFDSYITKNQVTININSEPWIIKNSKQMKIKETFERTRTKFSDWNILFSFGVNIKLKDAFIINTKTKEEWIKKGNENAEIIKPYLKAKDVRKWKPESSNLWVIVLPSNITEMETKENYPVVYEHLLKSKLELFKSKKTSNEWELLNTTFTWYQELGKSKIIFPKITNQFVFCFMEKELYPEENLIFLAGENLKYLLALLNSRIVNYMLKNFYSKTLGHSYKLEIDFLKEMPLMLLSKEKQLPFVILVDWILFAKESKMEKEISTIESVLDAMVADLYFEEELKRAGCYVLDKLSIVLKPMQETDSVESKKNYLTGLHKFFLQDKVIYNSLIHRRNIDAINILYGDNYDR